MVIEPSTPPTVGRGQDDFKPLFSLFHDDAEMSVILDEFLHDMLNRLHDMRTAMDANDITRLNRIIHKIKGAAGGYGYPSITECAEHVEHELSIAGMTMSVDVGTGMATMRTLIERAYKTRLHHLPDTHR